MTDKKTNNFTEDVMALHEQGFTPLEIAHKLSCKYYDFKYTFDSFRSRIRTCISRHKNKYYSNPCCVSLDGLRTQKEKRIAIQNNEPTKYEKLWTGATEIKIAIIGDTHFGSKYTQFTHLNNFYDICEKEGVKDVYHVGDLTDGLKMRPGHEYELYVTSADDMLDDFIEKYPRRKGIITHYITGNHDASIYKHVGYDIGRAIEQRRDDMDYLGRDCAVIKLTDNCTLELRHPWDGTAYALSYKPQKMIEAMESDSKPNILAIGHYHKAEYLFYRNVHSIQTGAFQGQTPFTRGKGISVNLGGWIVTIQVATDGTIKSIQPQFIPYYSSISNDYKNR